MIALLDVSAALLEKIVLAFEVQALFVRLVEYQL
jgi:hypothetical protein